MRRLRACLTNLALLLGGLALALLLGEGLVRLFNAAEPITFDKTDTVLGARYLRDLDLPMSVDGRDYRLVTNSAGFHSPEYPERAAAGVTRLLFLGDSYTAGTQVNLVETFPQQTAERLAQRLGHPVQAVNLGVATFSNAQELLAYRSLGVRYDRDAVILGVFVGNDVVDNMPGLSNYPRPYFDVDDEGDLVALPFRPRLGKRGDWIRNSALVRWQKVAINRLIGGVQYQQVHYRYDVYNPPVDDTWRRAWAITEKLLLAIRDLADEQGDRLLVLIIPEEIQVRPEAWEALLESYPTMRERDWDLDYPHRRLRALFDVEGIDYLDLLEPLRRTPGDFYFDADPHFNAAGHAQVAAWIADRLAAPAWLGGGGAAGRGVEGDGPP